MSLFNRKSRQAASDLLNAEVEKFEQWQARTKAERIAQSQKLLEQLKDCYALLETQEQNVIKIMLKGGR